MRKTSHRKVDVITLFEELDDCAQFSCITNGMLVHRYCMVKTKPRFLRFDIMINIQCQGSDFIIRHVIIFNVIFYLLWVNLKGL